MIKKDLVIKISNATNHNREVCSEVLEATMEAIKTEIRTGGTVYLRGFGTLKTVIRKAKPVQNISKGETFIMPAHPVVKFKESKSFLNRKK